LILLKNRTRQPQVCFRGEAAFEWQAGMADSVENDPEPTSATLPQRKLTPNPFRRS
jgi:hypothetical protein